MNRSAWINQSQPQTLVIATFLLYFNALFGLLGIGTVIGALAQPSLFALLPALYVLVTVVGGVLAGRGLAAEKQYGYYLALGVALAPFILRILMTGSLIAAVTGVGLLTLIFEIALVALLLHPMSRDYVRTWFRK